MAITKTGSTTTEKKVKSSIGAPSQRNQSSRKGKKAWRKNVDLDEVEEVLEELRTEERVTGSTLQKKTNDELFQVDVQGDDNVRKHLPKFSSSLLTSAKILAQRSAIPAVLSRSTSSSSLQKRKNPIRITHEEKDRLLRIGKRMRKGPFNAVMDPTEMGAGSALLETSEAIKKSGGYDIWGATKDEEEVDEVVATVPGKKPKVKAPNTPHPRSQISLTAVPLPHEGTSYNPPPTAHKSLLRTAYEIEEKRLKEAQELAGVKKKVEEARKIAAEEENAENMMGGMVVDEVKEGQEEQEDGNDIMPAKKMPERKTKQERLKAAKRRAEKHALLEKTAQKRFLSTITAAKSLRKSLHRKLSTREQLRTQLQQQAAQEQLAKGLAGKKLGKHVVPEGEVDVQLGEDLSESLRGLKPEGNLFRDRFLNMQHRALVEPRVPVLPKRRRTKIKEYEKHAFKRFDREL